MTLNISFQGGLDLLFDRRSEITMEIPSGIESYTLSDLIVDLSKQIKRQKELFLDSQKGDTIRPGILVLVNDTDWDLVGLESYVLQDKDDIVFISTLHGG